MILIDKYAYINKIADYPPIEKLLLGFITMMICVISNSFLVYITVILFMMWMIVHRAGISFSFYWKLMMLPFGFLLMSMISIAINKVAPQTHILFGFNLFGSTFGVTAQSLYVCANLLLKALSSASCLYFIVLTTSLIDIISVLRKLKFPELFLELMSLIYRVIFILLDLSTGIYKAQSSRLGFINVKSIYRSLGFLLSALFKLSYKKTSDLFNSLDCRCYNGELKTLEKPYRVNKLRLSYIFIIEFLLVFAGFMFPGFK